MKHEIDLSKYQVRTDLAIESIENASLTEIQSKEETIDNIKVNTVYVDEKTSPILNKKIGTYITIEFTDITDYENCEQVKEVFSQKLTELLSLANIEEKHRCLVLGLGNASSTPDALGPLSIHHILITNHLFLLKELEEGFRPVSALAPGVMGNTGIETGDIVSAIVEKIKPDFVLVVDALASQSIERVNRTIQMTDTGIHPGSGVGNGRKEISFETLGIPVFAIGVPTVVDAVSIVSDTIHYMQKKFSYTKQTMNHPSNKLAIGEVNYLKKEIQINKEDKEQLLGIVGSLEEEEIREWIYEVLTPIGYNLMVTPKEVDFVIEKLSDVIGNGINRSLHKKVDNL